MQASLRYAHFSQRFTKVDPAERTHEIRWDEAPCGLFVASADGRFSHVNATFCKWLGYEASELLEVRCFQELLPIGARVFLQTHWAPLLQLQGSVSEVQLDFIRRDGTRVPMVLNAVRRQRNGEIEDEVAAFVATDRKLYERELLAARSTAEIAATDLKSADSRLRALNEELSKEHLRKDIFLATLAHELRNPLAPISNVVEVLSRVAGDPETGKWAVNILGRQVAQLSHLIDDLLDVSRITQGKVVLRLGQLDLAETLRLAAETASPAICAVNQTLAVDIATQPLFVQADRTRITQIAVNLLNNASKYSPAGAHIALRGWRDEDTAVFEVSDNGIGIPPEKLVSIFEVFSQLPAVLEGSAGGLGIGLALVKNLVRLHGGTVAAHSDGPGQGSRFIVRLPLTEEMPAPPSLAPVAVEQQKGRDRRCKIVIVDDNVDAADTLAMALALFDYEARTAHAATKGLDTIAEFVPDVAVIDIGLPDFDGYELARRIRRLPWAANLVLIAATGWGQDTDKQKAADAGFDAHFTKPVDFAKLHDDIVRLSALRRGDENIG
jgi:PAS domain S-box-containing protein